MGTLWVSSTNLRDQCVASFSQFKVAVHVVGGMRRYLERRPVAENEAMRCGRLWEIVAMRYWRQLFPHLETLDAMFTFLPADDAFGGTADGWVFGPDGERAVLEIKVPYWQTPESVAAWPRIPGHYLPQLEGEMRGFGCRVAYLAVFCCRDLSERNRLRVLRTPADQWAPCDATLTVWRYEADDRLWQLFLFPRLQLFKRGKVQRQYMSTISESNDQMDQLRASSNGEPVRMELAQAPAKGPTELQRCIEYMKKEASALAPSVPVEWQRTVSVADIPPYNHCLYRRYLAAIDMLEVLDALERRRCSVS